MPEHAEPGREWRAVIADLDLDVGDIDGSEVLPAEHAGHHVAGLPVRMARFDDAAEGGGAHDATQRHRLGVVGDRVHPAAHGGIDRQIEVAHQHLAIARRGQRPLDQFEMLGLRDAGGAGLEDDLPVDVVLHHSS